jgi:hypothetical protein
LQLNLLKFSKTDSHDMTNYMIVMHEQTNPVYPPKFELVQDVKLVMIPFHMHGILNSRN